MKLKCFREMKCFQNLNFHSHLIPALANVRLDDTLGVDGQPLVRVDHHTEQPGVGVDHHGEVAVLQVHQHGGLIEEGQVGHVLGLGVLGRVHLLDFLLLAGDLVALGRDHGDLVAGGGFDLGRHKACGIFGVKGFNTDFEIFACFFVNTQWNGANLVSFDSLFYGESNDTKIAKIHSDLAMKRAKQQKHGKMVAKSAVTFAS